MRRTLLALIVATIGFSGAQAGTEVAPGPGPGQAVATFAGGCFWCMEPPFDKIKGVVGTISGYVGGRVPNASYTQVSAGGTGHAEAVQVIYDPGQVTYEQLLRVFWRNIDPLAKDRQFCDSGDQYRSAIFVHDDAQRRAAEASKKEIEASGKLKGTIQTQIVPTATFYAAEDYHQDFYLKNPTKYKIYRWNCGRDQRLKEIWGAEAGGETS
ncbi:MAG: peptide-methionine (S)-S-oxide reductase [Variibacter sp.]|nr:peptide-methionine (S)-S-oxide reductase [Variibacter sp.]